VLKITLLLDVTPHSLVGSYQRFGVGYCLYLQNIVSYPEDGFSIFFRNFGNDLLDYTASHPRKE
jgi:hypothetical protein